MHGFRGRSLYCDAEPGFPHCDAEPGFPHCDAGPGFPHCDAEPGFPHCGAMPDSRVVKTNPHCQPSSRRNLYG